MNSESSFLGKGWSFPPVFDGKNCEAEMVTEEDDIRDSLIILLHTNPGERLMHPDYGCGIKKLVFDNITETEKTIIKDMIDRAVLFFEPRITLLKVEVDTDEISDTGTMKINLEYLVRTTNTRSNLVFPFYLLYGTDIEF